MKRNLQLKDGERLCDWCDRITDHIMAHDLDQKTLRDIIGEVSKMSYIHGSRDTQQIFMKHHH